MKNRRKRNLILGVGLLAAFGLWTVLLCFVDVRAIGPGGSAVGFGGLNGWLHEQIGVHMTLYHITDWMGLVPVAVGLGFALLGLVQWIGRKSLFRVDRSLFVFGGFYLVLMGAYLFFESVVINSRPVLINGYLEASYPSSTTLLVLCVMPTAWLQLRGRIKKHRLRAWLRAVVVFFVSFMVIGRLVSGVHWVADIVGGLLLSSGLVTVYAAFADSEKKK